MANLGSAIHSGVFASRPSATVDRDGELYYATDTNTLYHNDAGAWEDWPLDPGSLTTADLSDFDSAVEAKRLDEFAAPTGAVSFGGEQLTDLGTPTLATDAATKGYADALIAASAFKAGVRVATTVAGTLATSFEAGDTIDGVTLLVGDRILIKDQAAGAQNGIYLVNASGAPTRTSDADAGGDLDGGAIVFVSEGAINADTGWALTANAPITVGATALPFLQFLSATVVGALDDLADVTLTGLANDDLIQRKAGVFVNRTVAQFVADLLADGGLTEGVQDVIGAMVTAAGGSYNDGANTIAFPSAGTVAAEDVTVTPAGGIAATDVQAALEELDSEKAAAAHAHAASDITSGTVATARLGSGVADGTTFLRGDQTWAVVAGGGAALTVEEVDGTPTDAAITKIVFPNATLGIVGHVATYTPSGGVSAVQSAGALLAAFARCT